MVDMPVTGRDAVQIAGAAGGTIFLVITSVTLSPPEQRFGLAILLLAVIISILVVIGYFGKSDMTDVAKHVIIALAISLAFTIAVAAAFGALPENFTDPEVFFTSELVVALAVGTLVGSVANAQQDQPPASCPLPFGG